MNVALTRARHLLAVVGNADTLVSRHRADCKYTALIDQAINDGNFKQVCGS